MAAPVPTVGHSGSVKLPQLPVLQEVKATPMMLPTAATFTKPKKFCTMPLRCTPYRFTQVWPQIVASATPYRITRLNGSPKMMIHMAFRYSPKISATAAIEAVSETKNIAQPRRKAQNGWKAVFRYS